MLMAAGFRIRKCCVDFINAQFFIMQHSGITAITTITITIAEAATKQKTTYINCSDKRAKAINAKYKYKQVTNEKYQQQKKRERNL